eukprot:TRINITY_DN3982_c0_g2_i1.p1 TRINITY_DN3982_c0_g2~~TRINITY_DN3982_c0_g2_i1.p1  ORF type:complete len:318 (-),score=65.95 TRINITY_DN3982_c0_g2_i1:64-984(-)
MNSANLPSMNSASVGAPSLILRGTYFVAFVLLIIINGLAGAGKFFPSNKTMSDKYSTPITPAGYAFSIWGLIFTLQLIQVLYISFYFSFADSTSANYKLSAQAAHSVMYWMMGCWFFECAWQFAFGFEILKMVPQFFFILASLICAFMAFVSVTHNAPGVVADLLGREGESNKLLFFIYAFPVVMNAAWLNAATEVSVLVVVRAFGVRFHDIPVFVSAGLLILATVIGTVVCIVYNSKTYALTLVWAIIAIGIKQGGQVSYFCTACASILATVAGLKMFYSVTTSPLASTTFAGNEEGRSLLQTGL